MYVKCPNCLEIFQPIKKDEKILKEAIVKRQKLLIIECTKCYKDVLINPIALLDIQNLNKEKNIQCPICKEGIVSYIDDEDECFWGCGECGNVWFTKSNLDDAINNCH